MRPSQWTEMDKESAREQARLGALSAIEELQTKFNSMLVSKVLNMLLGYAIIHGGQLVLIHFHIT